MRVDISKIIGAQNAVEEFSITQSGLQFAQQPFNVANEGEYSICGQVKNVGDGLFELEATFQATLVFECDRCLKIFEEPFTTHIKEIFSRQISKGEDETYFFEQNLIELEKPILDNILLALPLKTLCNENCENEFYSIEKQTQTNNEPKAKNPFGELKAFLLKTQEEV